jgi:hypothetical protein
MRKQLLRTSVVALLAAAIGYGQSPRMYVDIPFSFVAGGATLPAGAYTVATSTSGVIVVKSAEQKAGAIISTVPVQSVGIQPASKLIFRRYGSTYLLSQIWTLGDYNGRETPVKSSERELAKRYNSPAKTVAVSAE